MTKTALLVYGFKKDTLKLRTAIVQNEAIMSETVRTYIWHPSGDMMVFYADGTARRWDVSGSNPVQKWTGMLEPIDVRLTPAISPSGDLVAFNNSIWDIRGPQPVARPLPEINDRAETWSFTPDGKRFFVGYQHGSLWSYDTANPGVGTKHLDVASNWVQLSPDGGRLLIASGPTLVVRDAATMEVLWKTTITETWSSPVVMQLRWAPDSRHILLGQHGLPYVIRVAEAPRTSP